MFEVKIFRDELGFNLYFVPLHISMDRQMNCRRVQFDFDCTTYSYILRKFSVKDTPRH